MTYGLWEFQGFDESDQIELLMHDRFQQSESPDFGADHHLLVFVATSSEDHGVRGADQSARLRELLNLVAPDGVIPRLGEVLQDIATNVPHMLAMLAEDGEAAVQPLSTQEGDYCLSCGTNTRPDGSCECDGWGGEE